MSDSSRKRKKRFFNSESKRSKYALNLCTGIKGFLITHNGHPKFCIREAYNLLDEFFTQDKSKIVVEGNKKEDDFESELKKDIENAQNEAKDKEFQVVETGVAGCVFIKTNNAHPVEIMAKILQRIIDVGRCHSRKILRMLPIEVTCKAYLEDIKKAITPLLNLHFKGEAKTYAIIVNRRNNSNILRDELIGSIGLMIRDRSPFHSADLKTPQLTVLVEILKSICCLAVVGEYNKFRKYNLVELGLSCQKAKSDKNDCDKAITDSKNNEDNIVCNEAISESNHSLNKNTSDEKSEVDNISNGKDSNNDKNEELVGHKLSIDKNQVIDSLEQDEEKGEG